MAGNCSELAIIVVALLVLLLVLLLELLVGSLCRSGPVLVLLLALLAGSLCRLAPACATACIRQPVQGWPCSCAQLPGQELIAAFLVAWCPRRKGQDRVRKGRERVGKSCVSE
jgi:hypothetical protein